MQILDSRQPRQGREIRQPQAIRKIERAARQSSNTSGCFSLENLSKIFTKHRPKCRGDWKIFSGDAQTIDFADLI